MDSLALKIVDKVIYRRENLRQKSGPVIAGLTSLSDPAGLVPALFHAIGKSYSSPRFISAVISYMQ